MQVQIICILNLQMRDIVLGRTGGKYEHVSDDRTIDFASVATLLLSAGAGFLCGQ